MARLEAMTLGCAWLLERWEELREILEQGLLWQSHDRLRAIRLLGRQPLEAVDDRRVMAIYLACWAMEGGGADGFTDLIPELTPKERPVYLDRLHARAPMVAMPEGPTAARAELLALIAQEEERLEEVLTGHLEREEAEAAAEQAFDATTYGERLRGYEALNDRLLVRIVEALRKRHEADETASPGGRVRRNAEHVLTAPNPHPDSVDSGWLGTEAVSAVEASRGRAPDAGPCPPGGGAGQSAGLTPATRTQEEPIGADPRSASPAERDSSETGVAPPHEIESAAVAIAERVEPDPVEPADSPPTETAGDDEWEANGLTEEEIRYRNARILEVLGCGPPVPTEEASSRAPSEAPRPDPARTEPLPAGGPSRASADLNTGTLAVPGADDGGPRIPPKGTNRPVAPARRLAGAVLGLFALLAAAGLPADSARPVVAPKGASPGGPIGRMLARWSSHEPTWAIWLCSSRALDDSVALPLQVRGSGPIPRSPG